MSVQTPQRPDLQKSFPSDEEYAKLLGRKKRNGLIVRTLFLGALAMAVLAVAALLYTIVNESFGLVAQVNQVEPEEVVVSFGYDPAEAGLADLSYDELVETLAGVISTNVGRRLERERRFYPDRLVFESEEIWAEVCSGEDPSEGCDSAPRDHADLLQLVGERVIAPDVIAAANLVPSLLDPEGLVEEVERSFNDIPGFYPEYTFDQVRFEWRAWLNPAFLTTPQSATPETTGIRNAILGTLWLVVITVAFAVPIGVGAAVYLEEFAPPGRFNEFIQTNINNLAGVPSIIYGMLGLAVFVRALEAITSGAVFGVEQANGRTVLAAGMTMGLLTLPVVIISSQEALKAVPGSLRQAGLGVGATRWQTIRSQVFPVALPGILTGVILAVARAIGETAPLILVGAAGFITADPTGPFSKFTALPIQIFQWTALPQFEWQHLAAAASLTLLILLLILNAGAVILRNRYSRRPS